MDSHEGRPLIHADGADPAAGAGPATRRLTERLSFAGNVTRSQLRRYPRQLLASLREVGTPPRAVRPIAPMSGFTSSRLGAVWLGHATVLLRMGGPDGVTILTDPVFSERVGMSMGGVTLGPARLLPPALDVGHLPRVDFVLLSHAHFDHLDKPSLRRLAGGPAQGATVVTADRTRSLIPSGFGEVVQLGWGRQARFGDLRIQAMRPRHWGARAGLDRRRGYNAYLIEYRAQRVLFGGDTAYTDAFDCIGAVDLSVLGIGAYEGWHGSHATPEQAWAMFLRHAAADRSRLLPMHHSTFDMGEKRADEPLERLLAAAAARARQVVCRRVGDRWVTEEGGDGGDGGEGGGRLAPPLLAPRPPHDQ